MLILVIHYKTTNLCANGFVSDKKDKELTVLHQFSVQAFVPADSIFQTSLVAESKQLNFDWSVKKFFLQQWL